MRPRWIILGLFLAGIVYGTIIWWPERAMWETKLSGFSNLLAFSEDSKNIFTLDDKRNDLYEPIKPHLSRWDTLTGRLLQETLINLPEPLIFPAYYEISSDGTALIVRGGVVRESGPDNAFFVIDASSGQKHLGPIYCSNNSHTTAKFSRNGCWIVYSFPSEKHPASDGGIEVIDSKTGNKILRVKTTEPETIEDTCFSPDGSAIAFLDYERGVYSIHISELPSGKERNRFPITIHDWVSLKAWKGDHLTVFARMLDSSNGEVVQKFFTIDLKSNPIGQVTEHPELGKGSRINENGKIVANWQECDGGNGWKAEIQLGGDPDFEWIWKFLNKCAEWIGAQKTEEPAIQARLRVIDINSNRIRYQSPLFVNSGPVIAKSGAVYAVSNGQGELSLWNANPFPRWPWALAASLATLLLILLLGRWRYKREKNPGLR